MKRILQVVGCLELGGTEAFIMNHYRNINREEYQFDFMVLTEKDYPYIPEIEQLGGRVFFVGVPTIKNYKQFFNNFKKVIEENGPYNVIHSHINVANSWILYSAKKLNIPVRISHSHDTSGLGGNIIKKLFRKLQVMAIKRYATHFLACSNAAGEYLYGEEFFDKYGKVIHNGINVDGFQNISEQSSKELKTQFEISDKCNLVVGNITRFEDKKNSLFTVDVFNEILKKEPSSVLVMGGPDGGLLSAVEEKIKSLNIEQNVRLIGPRKDIPVCLSIFDVYLFPSKFEGLGIVMLEAQASGCECFPSTGVSKECDMGIGSVHFCSLDDSPMIWATQIVETLKKKAIVSNEKIAEQFAKNGYDIKASVKTLLEVYDEEQ